jgi:nucleosome binding factor SPN SPT16 subunit
MTKRVQDLPEDQEGFMCDMAGILAEYDTTLSPETMWKLLKTVVTDGLNHHMDGACTYLMLSRLFEAEEGEEEDESDEEEEDDINKEGFMAEVGIYHGEADKEETPSIKESVTNDIF